MTSSTHWLAPELDRLDEVREHEGWSAVCIAVIAAILLQWLIVRWDRKREAATTRALDARRVRTLESPRATRLRR